MSVLDGEALTHQWGKFRRGELAGAVRAGLPVRSLRTVARVAVHATGNRDGVYIRTGRLAMRVGVSMRTIQRDLAGAARRVRGLRIERDRPKGELRRSYPNRYHLPQVTRDEPGTVVWAALLECAAWSDATPVQQGVLLYLLDALGREGRALSYGQLARDCRIARSTARVAVAFWRARGWLAVEQVMTDDNGWEASRMRVRCPWEPVDAPVRVDEPLVVRARELASVIRWAGERLAELAASDAGVWDRVEEAVLDGDRAAREDLVAELAAFLAGAARELGYHGSADEQDIADALPYVWDRRATFRAPARAAASGDLADGDWRPHVDPSVPELDAYAPAAWPGDVAAAGVEDVVAAAAPVEAVGVDGGALVLVVEREADAQVLADAVPALQAAVGGAIALRLRATHEDLLDDRAEAHVRAVGASGVERLQARAAALELAFRELPPIPTARVGAEGWRAAADAHADRVAIARWLHDARDLLAPAAAAVAWRDPDGWGEPRWRSVASGIDQARVYLDQAAAALQRP